MIRLIVIQLVATANFLTLLTCQNSFITDEIVDEINDGVTRCEAPTMQNLAQVSTEKRS